MQNVVVGVFKDEDAAGKAIEELRNAGFVPGEISIVAPNETVHARPSLDAAASSFEHVMTPADATSPADKTLTTFTLAGALVGGVVGLAAGLLAPAGAMLGAGPLFAAITSAAAGSYVGTIAGALMHFDVPEHAARIYETHVSSGNILVAVHTDDPDERFKAEEIFDRLGVIEIDMKVA